jgi:hypothetical protein
LGTRKNVYATKMFVSTQESDRSPNVLDLPWEPLGAASFKELKLKNYIIPEGYLNLKFKHNFNV